MNLIKFNFCSVCPYQVLKVNFKYLFDTINSFSFILRNFEQNKKIKANLLVINMRTQVKITVTYFVEKQIFI